MTDLPLLDLALMPPGEFSIDVVGTSLEGGRTVIGNSPNAVDYSGGGFWTIDYDILSIFTPAQHRYLNSLAARLNSPTNKIAVPILNDWTAPLLLDARGEPILPPASEPAATLSASAALNAGTISFNQTVGTPIKAGHIFSIRHSTDAVADRAYRIAAIDSETPTSDHSAYAVAIVPPLREATASGTALRWYRPRCTMQLKPGTTIPWKVSKFWKGQGTLSFWEGRWDT